jgi:5-methylcytosine-specific restriction endonuclease McrA
MKKKKIWRTITADRKFSDYIRKRDGKCIRCGKISNLQCSHFWSRIHSSTRFDPENCDTLCYPCHYGNLDGWEYDQAGAYRDFKIKQLGLKKFNKLDKKHRQFKQRHKAIKEFMKKYEKTTLSLGSKT